MRTSRDSLTPSARSSLGHRSTVAWSLEYLVVGQFDCGGCNRSCFGQPRQTITNTERAGTTQFVNTWAPAIIKHTRNIIASFVPSDLLKKRGPRWKRYLEAR